MRHGEALRLLTQAICLLAVICVGVVPDRCEAASVEERLASADTRAEAMDARIDDLREDMQLEAVRLRDERDTTLQLASLAAVVLLGVFGWFVSRALAILSDRLQRTSDDLDVKIADFGRDADEGLGKLGGKAEEVQGELDSACKRAVDQIDEALGRFSEVIERVKQLTQIGIPYDVEVSKADELRLRIAVAPDVAAKLALFRQTVAVNRGEFSSSEYHNYGVQAENSNAPGLAGVLFEKAYEVSGGDPDYGRAYAQTLGRVGRVDEAVEIFTELVEQHARHAPLHAFYIDVLRMGNRFDEAQSLYDDADESVREAPIVLREMASMYEDMDEYEKGISYAERAVAGMPSDVVAHGLLSRLRFALGNYSGAEAAAWQALSAASGSTPEGMIANNLSFLGYALKAQQNYAEAARIFQAHELVGTGIRSREELWHELSALLAGDTVDKHPESS